MPIRINFICMLISGFFFGYSTTFFGEFIRLPCLSNVWESVGRIFGVLRQLLSETEFVSKRYLLISLEDSVFTRTYIG